uniref:Putative secreted protein n=1 Tax=Anopheles triannulatus TaxID=58253 RepID=A0A2M4B1V5_9DIPT
MRPRGPHVLFIFYSILLQSRNNAVVLGRRSPEQETFFILSSARISFADKMCPNSSFSLVSLLARVLGCSGRTSSFSMNSITARRPSYGKLCTLVHPIHAYLRHLWRKAYMPRCSRTVLGNMPVRQYGSLQSRD